ncbi:MAG: stage V sporulation protein AC [Clostridiales bacterium]|jgi:stage V sporulation protein AC|nr:stage V sporulation protein AC [Clostridiales bacterium]
MKPNLGSQEYSDLVKRMSPPSNTVVNCLKAFAVGGLICCVGQVIINFLMSAGLSKDDAGMYTSIVLIFAGTLLTGIGVYDKIGEFAGAGSVVPITGFANSVAAPALEFKKEGFVMGMGAKMFIVAGPVLVYGTLTSILVGIVYYIIR